VLAFDDAALARVVIAATAIPVAERSSWLASIAERMEKASPTDKPSKKTRAEIQSDYRKRKRAGLMLLRVSVDDVAVPDALVQAGLLAPAQTDNSEAVADAIERMLSTIVSESHEKSYR
jgi:hypothetical protein